MHDDYALANTWDLVEQLADIAPVEIVESERGLEFKNYLGDVVGIIYVAGTTD